MLSTAFPLVPVVDEPALTPAELSILQAITGGQGLIDQIANNASERNNFLVEARVVLDAHSRGLTNLVAGADVRTMFVQKLTLLVTKNSLKLRMVTITTQKNSLEET